MGAQNYNEAIREHKQAIREEYRKLWLVIRIIFKTIRTHKLLIKQVKIRRRLDILNHYELKIPVTHIPGQETVTVRHERS